MKRWTLFLLLLVTAAALEFAACSGGSGGGSDTTSSTNTNTTATTVTTSTTTTTTSNPNYTSNEDIEGSWNYNAGHFSGVLTFHNGRLVGFTNSQCSNQICKANMFLNTDSRYSIKFTNYGWCSASERWMKFAMNWTDGTKQTATGHVDVHYDPQGDYSWFTRYYITMRKRN